MYDIKKNLRMRDKSPRTARELADYFNVPYKTAWSWWAGKSLPKEEAVRSRLLELARPSLVEAPVGGAIPPSESTRNGKATQQVQDKGVPRHDLVAQLARARSLAAELNARLTLAGEEVKTTEIDGQQLDTLLDKFVAQLYDMSETLTVVVADNDRRQAFRSRVSKEDVAYLTTLLDSLLDEQKFTLWKAFQSFPMKGAKHK